MAILKKLKKSVVGKVLPTGSVTKKLGGTTPGIAIPKTGGAASGIGRLQKIKR